jgi:altronate dehydratase
MLRLLLVSFLLISQVQQPASTPAATPQEEANASSLNFKLLKVTRIYVDDFGVDPAAKQIQAMVVNSLTESKRFIITENKDKADAILKGVATEKTSQEKHYSADKAAAASGRGLVAADDSSSSTETINDAQAALRLVAADGDVIWSTTQESHGAKYKGAKADVADKIVKQLLRELEKLQRAASANK